MKNILDLGCGTGDLIRRLHKEKKDCNLYGIDFSSANIKTCIKKNKFGNVFFNVGVGENIEFEDNFFDEVYCMEVLEHVEDFDKTMKEIKRVLKDGRQLTLTVPLKKSEIILMTLNPNYFEQAGHHRFFSKDDILNELRTNKFDIKKYTAYNSIEHIYWAYAFKKGRNIISQLGVIDKKLPRIMRILVILLSREILTLRKSAKKPWHYMAISFLHIGYPFGLLLDKLYINKKQKIICINKK